MNKSLKSVTFDEKKQADCELKTHKKGDLEPPSHFPLKPTSLPSQHPRVTTLSHGQQRL